MKGISPIIATILLILFTILIAGLVSILMNCDYFIEDNANRFCELKFGNCTEIKCIKSGYCNIECGFETDDKPKIINCDYLGCDAK